MARSLVERIRSWGGRSGRGDATMERLGLGRMVALAVVVGLLGGWAEAALVRFRLGRGALIRLDLANYVWETPLAHVLAAVLVGVLLWLGGRLWRALRTPGVAAGTFVALSAFSFLLSLEVLYPLAAALLAIGVGVQAGRIAEGRFRRALLRWGPTAALLLSLVLVAVAALSLTAADRVERQIEARLGPGADAPNVLLIILDTVRAASMGLYVPQKSNTPGLNALARQAVVFDQAYAPGPWTLPSHASFLTGTWPHQHGADFLTPLDGRYPTLAEALAGHGYSTAGFFANLTWTNVGLERGFARFESYPVSLGQVVLSSGLWRMLASIDRLRAALGLHDLLNRVPAGEVNDRFLRWQRDRADTRPFFALLNYFDAHEPVPNAMGADPIAPLDHRNRLTTGSIATYVNRNHQSNESFFGAYRASYDAVIGTLDREITTLLAELDRRGVLDETVVIITSDHGEQLNEHMLIGHTTSLYLPTLHVPLLIRYPSAVPAGVRVEDEVSLRNLPALILDLTGLGGRSAFPGRSLARYWGSLAPTAGDTAYSHLSRRPEAMPPWAPARRGPEMQSVVDEGYHYILNGDGTEELYDLRTDPGELVNLAADPDALPRLQRLRGDVRTVRFGLEPGGRRSMPEGGLEFLRPPSGGGRRR